MSAHANVFVGPSPAELSHEAAFRVFSIVHQYGMQAMLRWCNKALQTGELRLWPSEPIESSTVDNHPGLVQCLALADTKQCDAMVQSCQSQLIKQGSDDAIHEALASPHLHAMMDGLRPETKTNIMCMMAGPSNYKVLSDPFPPFLITRMAIC